MTKLEPIIHFMPFVPDLPSAAECQDEKVAIRNTWLRLQEVVKIEEVRLEVFKLLEKVPESSATVSKGESAKTFTLNSNEVPGKIDTTEEDLGGLGEYRLENIEQRLSRLLTGYENREKDAESKMKRLLENCEDKLNEQIRRVENVLDKMEGNATPSTCQE